MIGQRIAEARVRAGLTQADLAAAVHLDRSALAKVESGHRRVSATELVRLADALDMRLEWFVQDPPPAIVARRNVQDPGAPSPRIDTMVERIARAIEVVGQHDDRFTLPDTPRITTPTTVEDAEVLALEARQLIQVPDHGPCTHLDRKAASIGLLVFSFELGVESADAATVLLRDGGVALINGTLHVGRRRLALAHEICHYLAADDYTVDWRVAEYQDADRRESMFDRFARALLLPAEDLRADWADYTSGPDGDSRTAAVRIASSYRVDMATLARRLTELGIVDHSETTRIRSVRTTQADIVELNLVVGEELQPPTLPREYELAILRLFRGESISTARALDLFFDTWTEDMLPELPKRTEEQIWQYL